MRFLSSFDVPLMPEHVVKATAYGRRKSGCCQFAARGIGGVFFGHCSRWQNPLALKGSSLLNMRAPVIREPRQAHYGRRC